MTSSGATIEKWGNTQGELIALRRLHNELSELSEVGQFLVYRDDAFENYLRKMLMSPSHLVTRVSAEVADGFCHLRMVNDKLFLNNIFLRSGARGRGRGRALLQDSIKAFRSELPQQIELDVFESNAVAERWYRSLGFTERHRTVWRLFEMNNQTSDPNLAFVQDFYGFTQIFHNGTHLGTKIGSCAVLHSVVGLQYLGTRDFREVVVRGDDSGYKPGSVELETTLRMVAQVSSVLESLGDS